MNQLRQLLLRHRSTILYGFCLAIFVFFLKWLQWNFLIIDHSVDIYAGLIALLFTALGIWIALQISKPKVETLIVEKEIHIHHQEEGFINEMELQKLDLSNREYEVLQFITKGCSNAEIAKNLYLSLSTVKTHVSNLFIKMEVKSRTQVIEKAKRLKITL